MKRITYLLIGILLFFSSCKPNEDADEQSILPLKFKVSIPDAITADNPPQAKADTVGLSGKYMYDYLRFFVHVGESAADIVQHIMDAIREYNLTQDVSFSFTGEDGRVKNVLVKSDVAYEGVQWNYGLVMTDAEKEDQEDGGVALQVFWSLNPVVGIAILKPAYVNVNLSESWGNALARIDYSESPASGYEAFMTVYIAGLPVDVQNKFGVQNLKMSVGNISGRIDIYGNSQHPEAWLLIPEHKGYDWAFVASASRAEDIAVAEVGLPPDTLNNSNREVLLKQYSLYNVLFDEIDQWYALQNNGVHLDSTVIAKYIADAQSPAYFGQSGFLSAGFMPGAMYNSLVEALENLSPYNPFDVANLYLHFEQFPISEDK